MSFFVVVDVAKEAKARVFQEGKKPNDLSERSGRKETGMKKPKYESNYRLFEGN